MPNTQPHHASRRYRNAAAAIRAAANADPLAVCRCGLTLDAHPLGVNGRRQRWTAGHGQAGSTTWQVWTRIRQPAPPGDWLAPEASRCNSSQGTSIARANTHGVWHGL